MNPFLEANLRSILESVLHIQLYPHDVKQSYTASVLLYSLRYIP